MDSYRNREVSFRFLDLLDYLLTKWKSILCFMIICGMTCFCLKFVRTAKWNSEASAENNVENNFSDTELEKLDQIASEVKFYQTQVTDQQDYLDHSLFMKLDWNNITQRKVEYFINLGNDTANGASDIALRYYQSVLENQQIYSEIAKNYGTEEKYISELITVGEKEDQVQTYSSSADDESNQISTSINVYNSAAQDNSNILSITIDGPDEDFCSAVDTVIENAISNTAVSPAINGGSYTISFLSSSRSTAFDTDIQVKQETMVTKLTSLQDSLNTLTDSLSSDQLSYVKKKSGAYSDAAESSAKESTPVVYHVTFLSLMKYTASGVLAGLLLSLFFWILYYAVCSRIQNAYVLEDIYNIPTFVKENTLSKPLSGFDKKAMERRYRNIHIYQNEALQDRLQKLILDKSREHSIHQIFVSGSRFTEADYDFISSLSEKMKDSGIQITYGDRIFGQTDAKQKMTAADYIIVLESVNQSYSSEIDQEIKFIAESSKPILAGIATL